MADQPHKYKRITLEKADGTILDFYIDDPASEPIFLLRGQDIYASQTVDHYAELLHSAGHEEAAEHAHDHAVDMLQWPTKKVPD